MFSREERLIAVELLIKNDKSAAKVRRKLGYSDRRQLGKWNLACLKEKETGIIEEGYKRKPKYGPEEKSIAIQYYLNHGRSIQGTIRPLEYPGKDLLRQWCNNHLPERKKPLRSSISYSDDYKQRADIDFVFLHVLQIR